MNDHIPNPYASPTPEQKKTVPPRPRWRLVPAVIFSVLGAIGLGIAAMGLSIVVYAVATQKRTPPADLFLGIASYLGVGLASMIAGVAYFQTKWRLAIVATIIAVLIPTIMFSILGV